MWARRHETPDRQPVADVALHQASAHPMTALLLAPQVSTDLTGLVWMPIVAILLPILFLIVIWLLGSRNTV